jgi:hypothetical protein
LIATDKTSIIKRGRIKNFINYKKENMIEERQFTPEEMDELHGEAQDLDTVLVQRKAELDAGKRIPQGQIDRAEKAAYREKGRKESSAESAKRIKERKDGHKEAMDSFFGKFRKAKEAVNQGIDAIKTAAQTATQKTKEGAAATYDFVVEIDDKVLALVNGLQESVDTKQMAIGGRIDESREAAAESVDGAVLDLVQRAGEAKNNAISTLAGKRFSKAENKGIKLRSAGEFRRNITKKIGEWIISKGETSAQAVEARADIQATKAEEAMWDEATAMNDAFDAKRNVDAASNTRASLVKFIQRT